MLGLDDPAGPRFWIWIGFAVGIVLGLIFMRLARDDDDTVETWFTACAFFAGVGAASSLVVGAIVTGGYGIDLSSSDQPKPPNPAAIDHPDTTARARPEVDPEEAVIEAYCDYDPDSPLQAETCKDHVTLDEIQTLDTPAARYALSLIEPDPPVDYGGYP